MHKRKKQGSSLQDRSTANASLVQCIGRIYVDVRSVFKAIQLKIRYGKSISINWVNSIRHTFSIILKNQAVCIIGNFLMVDGPLYVKAEDSAHIYIGDNVFFNHNCSITSKVKVIIGNSCNIANNVVIVDHDHLMSEDGVIDGYSVAPVEIDDNVWIGANVTVLKGVHIGTGAVIAAGAVVNCDVPACELWGGVPARRIKELRS